MRWILERLGSAARFGLPALALCVSAGPGALAAPAPAPAPATSEATDWPARTELPEDARFSASMPEEFLTTGTIHQGAERHSLSRGLPEDVGGQYPSLPRVKAPKGWKEDGRVTKAHVEKVVSGPGDLLECRMSRAAAAQVGDRFFVLRPDAAIEADASSEDRYLLRVGVVQAEALLPKGRVRLRVLKSGGDVGEGDLLSRKGL